MESRELHEAFQGKVRITPSFPLRNRSVLQAAYTPGIAELVRLVKDNPAVLRSTSLAGRLVLVASNGTAVLGLGNVGSSAAYPVMEGKAYLFTSLAGVDALPLVIPTENPEAFVNTLLLLRENYAAVNLEDIRAPECFEIERRLEEAGIPVMHDDQHGTAIVVLAALINALRITQKRVDDLRITILGAGPAGVGIARLLWAYGVKRMRIVDSKGIITSRRTFTGRDAYKKELAAYNTEGIEGGIPEALAHADVLIGVSRGGIVRTEWVRQMREPRIIFALANPQPEVSVEEAKAYASIIATGRSDDPNQINNVLAFPGVFKGLLESNAKRVTMRMKIAAAEAIARLIENPTPEAFMPSPLDPRVHASVAYAVKKAAEEADVERGEE